MSPAVRVLHPSGLADADEVLERLRRALLPLALPDGLAGLQLFELAIDDVRDAVLDFVDVQALRTGRARGMHGEALRTLPGRCHIVLRAALAPLLDAVERPVADLLGKSVPPAVAHVVEYDGAGLPLGRT